MSNDSTAAGTHPSHADAFASVAEARITTLAAAIIQICHALPPEIRDRALAGMRAIHGNFVEPHAENGGAFAEASDAQWRELISAISRGAGRMA